MTNDDYDTLEALLIVNRRLVLVIEICVRVFDALDGSLFLPPGVPDKISTARDQIALASSALALSKFMKGE